MGVFTGRPYHRQTEFDLYIFHSDKHREFCCNTENILEKRDIISLCLLIIIVYVLMPKSSITREYKTFILSDITLLQFVEMLTSKMTCLEKKSIGDIPKKVTITVNLFGYICHLMLFS